MRGIVVAVVLVLFGCACEPAGQQVRRPASKRAAMAPVAHGVSLATDDDRFIGSGPKVAVLGDSLVNAVHDDLHRALPRRAVAVTSLAGEGFTGGPWTKAGASPTMLVAAERYATAGPAVVVVALGTNDAWKLDGDPVPAVRELFAAVDGACTVAVLPVVDTTADGYDRGKAEVIVAEMESVADVVVDWRNEAQAVAVGDDGIHMTARGRAGYVDAIADGVHACD